MENKQIALHFLKKVVSGDIDEAYQNVDMKGKHHNVFFPAGFSELREAMKKAHVEFPNKKFEVKHVLGDGDMVAVHSHVSLKPGELEVAVVHLFRFKNGKIVEIWDCGQEIPKDMKNADGAF